MSDSEGENEQFYFSREDLPQRTSSAPPVLEVQENSLFAMGNTYAHLFSGAVDIRADDDYIHFYNSHNDPSKLPPPLERPSFDLNEDPSDDYLREVSSSFSCTPSPELERPALTVFEWIMLSKPSCRIFENLWLKLRK